MHHCHEPNLELITFGLLENFDNLALIITLFVTGLAGSFTHCIGMCGPIAVSQMSMRLMNLPINKTTQPQKFNCAFTLPYYAGKTIAYSILALCMYFFMEKLHNIPFFRSIAFVFLVGISILFLWAAFFKTFSFSISQWLNFTKPFEKFVIKATSCLQLSTYGFKGVLQGMILGFIPCGLVYSSIIIVITYANSAFIVVIAMLAFGMATIPGLFISAYFGSVIFTRFKRVFNLFYSIIMLLNAFLLMRYALKLI